MVRTAGFMVALALAVATGAEAQQGNLAVGYTGMPGRLGESESDRGVAFRLGLDLTSGSRVRLGLEAGFDRLNLVHRQSTTTCFLPGGATGPCHFDSRRRDTGRSLSAILRIQGNPKPVQPYATVGIGYLSVRTREKQQVTDDAGTVLTNFSFDGSTGDSGLPLHLGVGLVFRPTGFPVGITFEGRATGILHNYSGGLQTNIGPTVLIGVRSGR